MNTLLSAKQQCQLSEAIEVTFGLDASLQDWTPMPGGQTTCQSFTNCINDQYAVVARFLDPATEASSRAQERLCTQRASDMDVGAPLFYHDDHDTLLLMAHIKGTPLSRQHLSDTAVQVAVASQIELWHQAFSDSIEPTPTICQRIQKLETQTNSTILNLIGLGDLATKTRMWTQYIPSDTILTPCHGDPNPSNMIQQSSGTVKLIDWSHAGLNDSLLDFAVLAQYIPENALPKWHQVITGHVWQGDILQTLTAYQNLLYLHCALWALNEAQTCYHMQHEYGSEEAWLAILRDEISPNVESIANIQNRWFNGQFNHNNYQEYLSLMQTMLNLSRQTKTVTYH